MMAKRWRISRFYEESGVKIDAIKKRYNKKNTAEVIEALIENIASVDEMDALFGFSPKKTRLQKFK